MTGAARTAVEAAVEGEAVEAASSASARSACATEPGAGVKAGAGVALGTSWGGSAVESPRLAISTAAEADFKVSDSCSHRSEQWEGMGTSLALGASKGTEADDDTMQTQEAAGVLLAALDSVALNKASILNLRDG